MSVAGALDEAFSRADNTMEMTEGRVLRVLTDVLLPVLSPPEFVIAVFIFRRTWMYGKPVERIPMSHFTHGIYSGDECIHPGVGMSRTQVYEHISRLVENVYILRSSDHPSAAPSYGINPMLMVSGKPDRGVRKTGQGVSGIPDYKYKNNKREIINRRARSRVREDESVTMPTPKEAALAAMESVTKRHTEARGKAKAKDNATAYAKIWHDQFKITFPDDRWFAWTVAQLAAFRKALDRGKIPSPEREAFITFVVEHFTATVGERFAWMQSRPALPNPAFVTKHIALFWQAFEDDRDPNRKVKARISRFSKTADDEAPPIVSPQPDVTAELERLRNENAALKLKDSQRNIKARKKLIRPKPRAETGDDEFGQWSDDD